jgi:hypothetical protein
MTWRVRAEGQLDAPEILVDDPAKMAEIVRQLRAGGRKVAILDAKGKQIDATTFPGLEKKK